MAPNSSGWDSTTEGKVVRTRALVPEAPPALAWEEIRSRKEERAILLASHEPLMSSLAAFLLGSPALQVDMKSLFSLTAG